MLEQRSLWYTAEKNSVEEKLKEGTRKKRKKSLRG